MNDLEIIKNQLDNSATVKAIANLLLFDLFETQTELEAENDRP